jgi:hypothetical protein
MVDLLRFTNAGDARADDSRHVDGGLETPSSATRRELLLRSDDAFFAQLVFLVQKIASPFSRFCGWMINTLRRVLDLLLAWTDDFGTLAHGVGIFVFYGL